MFWRALASSRQTDRQKKNFVSFGVISFNDHTDNLFYTDFINICSKSVRSYRYQLVILNVREFFYETHFHINLIPVSILR